jgi:hypothetical protein
MPRVELARDERGQLDYALVIGLTVSAVSMRTSERDQLAWNKKRYVHRPPCLTVDAFDAPVSPQ